MKFPTQPTVTLLLYRASNLVTSLGSVSEYHESDFSIFTFLGFEYKKLEEKLVELIVTDMRATKQAPHRPASMRVLLADGLLPTGDLKHDLDCIHRRAIELAQTQVDDEDRAATIKRLQAERDRIDRDARFAKDRDFAALKTLLGKYSQEELRAAGVFQDE